MTVRGLHFGPAVTKVVNGKRITFSQIESYDGSGGPWCLDANSNSYPSNGDNIQLWKCDTNDEQFWYYDSSNGLIYNYNTSYCLDANSNSYPSNGDNIQLWGCNGNPEQSWLDMPIYPTFGNITNTNSHYCIDANSNSFPSNGDNIQLWGCNGNSEQLWSSSQ